MYTEEIDSMMKKTLKSLCCSNGWCYAVFWGFDQRNSLLLSFKDAYYEEQMGALVDTMLYQAHVLGGGVIGQAAFTKTHRWMYSDALHERQSSLGSFDSLEVFEEDSEFFCQFSMGIKTIAVISVEPWGVLQLGSTQKNPETESFVDHVKELFGDMDKHQETHIIENEPHHSQVLDSSNSVLSDQNWNYGSFSQGFMGSNDSLVLPSQSFPSTSDHQSNFFDCSSTQPLSNHCDDSLLNSSWQFLEESMCFSTPMDYESCRNPSSNPPVNFEELFKLGQEDDDFSQWFCPQFGSAQFTTLLSTENLPTNSIQSSVTDVFRTSHEVKDSELNLSTGVRPVGSTTCSSNSLFSRLGLDQLLGGASRLDDQSSSASKRRKIDNFSWSQNQVKFKDHPSFDRKMKMLKPLYNLEAKNIEPKTEESTKEPHSCASENYGIDAKKTGSSSMRQEEQVKTKKKAKPGTRPRPKDRQMIQDRFSELRGLIPNGEKMSIDRLLEQTIKHMNFMQSLTKHAESLKQIQNSKNREVKKNQSSNGVTWACEIGDETMACPLIVEDLTSTGQMLIEMLCEEQGFFLEIVNIIRGFGLIIRKGVMEVRETNKIWAHFLVEAEGSRILEVDGTVTTQPVLEHVGISTWPGRLTLTDHALYFEALRVVSYDKAKSYDLADDFQQVVKPELTGPWGTRLFDKAVFYKSITLSEPVVMEFPELKGHTRRDYWLAIIREVLYAHRFMLKFRISGLERDEVLLKAIFGIVRVQALKEMSSTLPLCFESLLMFNVCDQLPRGDLILEKLANMLAMRKIDHGNEEKSGNGMYPISALSLASNLGFAIGTSSGLANDTGPVVGEIFVGEMTPLEKAVKEARSSYQKVVLAQATVDGVKVNGIDTNLAVMKELLSPVTEIWNCLVFLIYWEEPLKSLMFCLVFTYIICRGWTGYAFAAFLIFFAFFMLLNRSFGQGKPVDELKVIAPPPMNTMEQLLAVQNAISQAEELIQDGNIVLLKFRALLLSIFPQASERFAFALLVVGLVVAVLPVRYIFLLSFLETFTRYCPLRRSSTERWMRRLRDWWFSIPAAPVHLKTTLNEDKKRR